MITKKTFLTVFAISIALIFLMAPVASASHSINPATTSASPNYQPDPTLNTNVSWSTFYHGWNATEYNNGTANTSLNAGFSSFYKNPIGVNPTDIIAPGVLQGDKLGSYGNWTNTSLYTTNGESNSSYPVSLATSTLGGQTILEETLKANGTGNSGYEEITIPEADYPSSSLAYDYVTVAATLSGPAGAGGNGEIKILNQSTATVTIGTVTVVQTIYISEPLTTWQSTVSFNTTGTAKSDLMQIQLSINAANGVAAGSQYTFTVTGMAFTDYSIPLGANSTGAPVIDAINPTMATFGSPALKYSEVIDNGYSVAVSASPHNLTQVQTALSSGSYIEQVQYSGTFALPSSPDLSYSTANITVNLTVPASQFQVLTLGGTSYTNTLGNRTNGTVQLVSGVPPTSSTDYYAIVDYTASQWQSISHPAGFFTYDGIAYYYWLAIGAIASLLALGVGVRHAKTKREQTEKVDRITRRGR